MKRIILKIASFLPDEIYLKLMYRYHMHKKLHLNNPKTFNEKLQWLKLHDRKDIYTVMVDKVAAKEYVAKRIGGQYIIPTLGVWDNPDDIDFSSLPSKFVIKCTHNSGTGMYICKDKVHMDIETVKRNLAKGLAEDYYLYLREWPYKNVPRKIIAEQFIESGSDEPPIDYKVLCFAGKVKLIEVHSGRFTDHQTQDYYDVDWVKTGITQNGCSGFGASDIIIPKPQNLDKMIEFSELLSSDVRHLRVDWYSVGEKLYFGEMTFFDGSGLDAFDNEEDDLMLGNWIDLS